MKYIMIVLLICILIASTSSADTINLAWDKVTQDVDGNPIQELTGYKLYSSNVAGTYTNPLATITPAIENFSYTQTVIGTYYFTVTAYNASGESARSNEVSTVVAAKLPKKVQNLHILP